MEKIIDKLKLYDLFGYFIPGILTVLILKEFYIKLGFHLEFSLNNKVIDFILLIILSYVVGIIVHEISQFFEYSVLKKLWGGSPSERALLKEDKLLSDEDKEFYYSLGKNVLRKEINPNSKCDSHKFFIKLRETLRQKKLDEKAEIFNAHYGLSRNLLIVSILCFALSFLVVIKNKFHFGLLDWIDLMLFSLTTIIIGIRVKRFGEKFVKTVFEGYAEYTRKEPAQFVIGNK